MLLSKISDVGLKFDSIKYDNSIYSLTFLHNSTDNTKLKLKIDKVMALTFKIAYLTEDRDYML